MFFLENRDLLRSATNQLTNEP